MSGSECSVERRRDGRREQRTHPSENYFASFRILSSDPRLSSRLDSSGPSLALAPSPHSTCTALTLATMDNLLSFGKQVSKPSRHLVLAHRADGPHPSQAYSAYQASEQNNNNNNSQSEQPVGQNPYTSNDNNNSNNSSQCASSCPFSAASSIPQTRLNSRT